jgi:hypothetical protein
VASTGSATGKKIPKVLSAFLNKIIASNVVNLFEGV